MAPMARDGASHHGRTQQPDNVGEVFWCVSRELSHQSRRHWCVVRCGLGFPPRQHFLATLVARADAQLRTSAAEFSVLPTRFYHGRVACYVLQ